MGKRALVIGGTGFLGKAIVHQLHNQGWEVDALGRNYPLNSLDEAAFLQADRTIPGKLKAAIRDDQFDLVVDCAAYKQRDVLDAIDVFLGQVEHYIFISTDYVYAFDDEAAFPIGEDAPKQMNTAYAEGKLQCESALIEAWNAHAFPVTVLRPPHIMGAGKGLGCDIAQGRDPHLLQYIRSGKGLTLLAEGQILIQPVWNREIAACISYIARMKSSYGQIFNCTGSECVTTLRYYQMIAASLGVRLSYESTGLHELVERKPEVKHYARHRMYDLNRLRDLTGYVPQFHLKDAIEETIEWMSL